MPTGIGGLRHWQGHARVSQTLMALNPELPPWDECRVWVIGASTGIGAATTKALLAAGARVALSARQAALLVEIAEGSPRAVIEALDYTESSQVSAAWERVRSRWDGI